MPPVFTCDGIAAPGGWLEGDPSIYALHVELDGPEVAAYSDAFENADGTSLNPEAYLAIVLDYASWASAQEGRADDD